MRIALLRGARAIVMACFVVCAAALVGLSIYAVLQFGLWWPKLAGIDGSTRLILAAVTMLPFLLLFTKLNWSRPLGWLSARFNRLVEPIDRAIER
ncbi:MAG: hypothetical protein HOK98_01965 [Rhodospirillaceae bacterium]|jgi:hypothetical protein|nr:hypothetical protein [Rhodospirillaceae bacterium]MBT5944260.1 hypothetical protein [Rhodospirillaceae bacterium]MBT6403934.1 hypothetical protein [Rhodospirillaceae bacterium]MBT6534921.1 hypothetical protein [Rhodospirillaceae bacterium]MBT7362781.1 hypothetical protein [Rhodospirillaceae bacterium]